jgi:hypothetical protein
LELAAFRAPGDRGGKIADEITWVGSPGGFPGVLAGVPAMAMIYRISFFPANLAL